jgi:hypothetical protein
MEVELLSQDRQLRLVNNRSDMMASSLESQLVYLPPTTNIEQLVEVLRWPTNYGRVEEAPIVGADATGIAILVWCSPEYVVDLVDAVLAADGGFLI